MKKTYRAKMRSRNYIVEDFHTLFFVISKTAREYILYRQSLWAKPPTSLIYWKLQDTAYSSQAHWLAHRLGCKTQLSKFKRIQIIQKFFSDHKKLNKFQEQTNIQKITRYVIIKEPLLSNTWVKEEVAVKIVIYFDPTKLKYNILNCMTD